MLNQEKDCIPGIVVAKEQQVDTINIRGEANPYIHVEMNLE